MSNPQNLITCLECGTHGAPTDTTCTGCGGYLPRASLEAAAEADVEPGDSAGAATSSRKAESSPSQDDFVVEDDQFGEAAALAALSAGWDASSAQPAAPDLTATPRRPPQESTAPHESPGNRTEGAPPIAERVPGQAQPAKDQGTASWRLRITSTETLVDIIEGAGVVLGRTPPSPIWDHPAVGSYVSSQHARVWMDGAQLFIKDLNSTNHTWVEGVQLEPGVPYPLRCGDVIQLTRDNPVRLEVVQ